MKKSENQPYDSYPVGELVSCWIEQAIFAFAKQLDRYQVMQAQLAIKADQLAASSKAKPADVMAIRRLLLQTMDASTQISAALRTLARLAHLVGAE